MLKPNLLRPLQFAPLFAFVLSAGPELAQRPNILWMRGGTSGVQGLEYTADGTTLVSGSEGENSIKV
jgi:hypothetical protein